MKMPTPILKIIFTNLVKKPYTNLFPKTPPIPIGDRFRGLPVYDENKCIGCRMCVTVCPTRTIIYIPEKKKVKMWVGRCLVCGLCADVCPTKAITMSKDFLLATSNKYNKRLIIEPKQAGSESKPQSSAQ